jgi:ketosteroid isomerase-like protein
MMNKTFFIIYSFFIFSVNGQSIENKEISKVVEELYQAMINADNASLNRLIADSLSYGHSSGKVEGKTEFIENIVSGKSDFVTIDLSEQTISVKNNIAVVRHKLIADTNDEGKPGNVKLKVFWVFEKEKGKWKLLARQSIKLV